MLDKIERLLAAYDTALDNILYKHFNPTEDQKAIREVLEAITYARNGPTDDEVMRDIMEWEGPPH